MVRLILVRHGHVDGIIPPRFRGRHDVELSDLGLRQAQRTAETIAQQWHLAMIYTSPLQRCVQTAAAIATASGAATTILEDLNDLHYGDWQWLTHAEVQEHWPDLFECWHAAPHLVRFPHGESLQDLVARASDVLRFIRKHHAGQTVVVVGHDSGNRALMSQLLDQPLSAYWRVAQDPCAVSEAELHARDATVRRINETQHLLSI